MAQHFAKAVVNNVKGLVVLPDDWSDTTAFLAADDGGAPFESNIIVLDQWRPLEKAGALFLPITGYRYYLTVYYGGEAGFYWSSTPYDGRSAFDVAFSDDLCEIFFVERTDGIAVRLVKDKE